MATSEKRINKLPVSMKINGVIFEEYVEPRLLLSDFLRNLGFKGTHVGCEHGVCGACTILFNGEAVRSCLMFAVQADGAEIINAEKLSADGELNDLQKAFRKHHALQCGFCTPGQEISATALLAKNPHPTEEEIKIGMSGNMCRCTGYHGIIEAVKEIANQE